MFHCEMGVSYSLETLIEGPGGEEMQAVLS